MKKLWGWISMIALGLGWSVQPAAAQHGGNPWMYEIKITNITKGTDLEQGVLFTPILLATHVPGVSLFELGEPASDALAMLAEGGATGPLSEMLHQSPGVRHVTTTDGPLLPGHSVTVHLPYGGPFTVLSLASMLVPTNDGFIGLNGGELPFYRFQTVSHVLPGYDAGSEINDELCASIPGPQCGGEGYSPADGEGAVHVHSGIHGIGDLDAADRDWHNPVVKIDIQLVRQ